MTAKPVDVAIRRVRNRAISRITRGCSRDDQPGCSYRPDLRNRRTHKGNRGTHKRNRGTHKGNRGTHKGADTRSNTRVGYITSPLQGRRNRSRGQFRRTALSPDSMETPGRTELRQTRSAFRLSLTDGLLLYLTCSPPNFWSVNEPTLAKQLGYLWSSASRSFLDPPLWHTPDLSGSAERSTTRGQ